MLNRPTSRRTFLKGTGALIVSVSVVTSLPAAGDAAPLRQEQHPGSPPPDQLDSWIKVQGDGTIKAFTGKVEVGQGVQVGLSQIIAEELDVPLGSVDLVMGDTDLTPDEGYTAASGTISGTGPHLRAAAAEARLTLLGLASKKLGVAPEQLSVTNGIVSAPGAGSISYADLIGNQNFNVQLTVKSPSGVISGKATPKDPSQYTLVGTSPGRQDIPPKMTGEFTYVQDVRVPGMVHGRVVRPTGIRSKLISIDGFREEIPGAQVLQKGDFVGVIANTEWDAIRAAQALQVTWSDWNGLPDMSDISTLIRGAPSVNNPSAQAGDVWQALDVAETGLSATYETPFEMHASIGPACAIADVQADNVTVWAGTQGPHPLRLDLSRLLDMPVNNIRVITVQGSGSYGRSGADLAAFDAVVMSQLAGKPVRVQWMRHDEHGWEPKGPAMVQDLQGGLAPNGDVVAWRHTVWTPPHFEGHALAGKPGGTLVDGTPYGSSYPAANLIGKPVGGPVPGSFTTPDLNYHFPNASILQFDQSDFADVLITDWLRSPAEFQHTFAQESFLDELAAAAGQDPVQFRLKYLTDDRFIAVLNAAAQAANWDTRPSPNPDMVNSSSPVVTGRGVALARRFGTLVAEVAQVQVDRSTGDIQILRFWAAQDCGLIVNPAAVQAQVEGNIIQATSRTLKEEVTFDSSNVTSLDWKGYPILTYPEVPKVETILINRPDQPSTGVGEMATNPVAAAISNAVFDATGIRLRKLPLQPSSVLAALGATA